MPNNNKKTNLKTASQDSLPADAQGRAVENTGSRKIQQQRATDLVKSIMKGQRVALGRAITLIESTRPEHQELACQIIEKCLPHANQSIRIGITGSPGVGKSSFIEYLGAQLLKQGRKVAVLAVDPSSRMSKGSILGDKTRMEKLAISEKAFIRPSPSGQSLGGVARKTREAIVLCEAAGFDTILIETVGVGQSETAVHSMIDFFLLLLLPGAGDELQGIKRGIVEMADLIAVNKSDGERVALAESAKRAYRNALHLLPPKENGCLTKVVTCSAKTGEGIIEIWQLILDYQEVVKKNGFFEKRRKEQARYWLYETIEGNLKRLFFENEAVKEKFSKIEKSVLEGKMSSFQGAETLLKLFLEK